MNKPDWEAIESAYRAGLLSVREIARENGITHSAIRKKANIHNWKRCSDHNATKCSNKKQGQKSKIIIQELLALAYPKKGEAFLSDIVKSLLLSENAHKHLFETSVPPIIRFEQEFHVKRGRVDFLLIHDDGTITVCELKDGSKGMQSVLAGIGQVIVYSLQIGMSDLVALKTRRVLMYTKTNSVFDDLLIYEACLKAGVIPLPIGSEIEYRQEIYKQKIE